VEDSILVILFNYLPEFWELLTVDFCLMSLQWINHYSRVEDDIEFENSWTLAIQLEVSSLLTS